MKTTLTQHEAADMLMKCEAFGTGRVAYNLCYTMAQYLEQYEEDTGEELELDPIAIRCEYRVLTLDEVAEQYSGDFEGMGDEDLIEYLQDNTTVIETDIKDTYIIQEF